MSTIGAGAVTVKALFEQRKVVPAYQRDYAWTPTQEIGALLDDLFEHFGLPPDSSFATGAEDDYLLGPVVVTAEALPQIIDGQQRVLTLFMLTAAIRTRLTELEGQEQHLDALKNSLLHFDDELDQESPRVGHHDDLANKALVAIAKYQPSEVRLSGTNASLSHRRIVHGFNHILGRLRQELPADAEKVWDFAKFLRGNVKLVKIETDDVGQALVVFERANFRGRPLDPSDLLKNLIFQNAKPEIFDALSATWREIQARIDETKQVQIIDFLRWHHLALQGGFYSTKRNFYTKIRSHVVSQDMDSKEYIEDLRVQATQLRKMATDGFNPALDARSTFLAGIRRLGGNRQKQHWPLLLAVSTWDGNHFEVVARGLERLLLFSYVTDHRSQELEREIRELTEHARELPPGDSNLLSLAKMMDRISADIRSSGLYEERFLRLSYDEAKPVVRFILTKIHDGLYRVYDNKTLMGADAASSVYEDSEIEHVWPQSDGEALATADVDDMVHRIGNLTLLAKPMNASGGKSIAEKKLAELYKQADEKYLIAKNLHDHDVKSSMGKNTAPNRAIAMTPTGFTSWGTSQIDELGVAYRTLLDKIMPPLTQEVGGNLQLTPTV